MKKRARLLALLLALVMIVTAFAACGNDGNEPDSTTTAPQSGDGTTGPDDTTPDTTTPGTDLDLEGYNFTIVGNGDVFPEENEDGGYKSQTEQQLADELMALEERLGITIEAVEFSNTNVLEQVTSAAMGGIKIGDLLWLHQQEYWPAGKANALLPLDEMCIRDSSCAIIANKS